MKRWLILVGAGLMGLLALFVVMRRESSDGKSAPIAPPLVPVIFGVRPVAAESDPAAPAEKPGAWYYLDVTAERAAFAVVFGFNSGGGFTPISAVTPVKAGEATRLLGNGKVFSYQFRAKGDGVVPGGPIYIVAATEQASLEAFASQPSSGEVRRLGIVLPTGEDESDRPRQGP